MASKNYSITLTSKSSPAFTIVELLVVIVVIGILAAITIVSYTGITSRATASALQSDLTNASQQLKLYQIDHSTYPTSLNASNCPLDSLGAVDTTYCLKPTSGNTFLYSSNNNSNPQTFSLYAINTSSSTKYRTTDSSSPTLATPVVATATGGYTVTNIGGYRIYTFTASGTFNVTSGGDVEVLVVAGGGGGGRAEPNPGGDAAGGGGAGGLIYDTAYNISPGSISVTVGAGGSGSIVQTSQGGNGLNSIFGGYTAIGGGGGGSDNGGANLGNSGGSGGGAANSYNQIIAASSATLGQGNIGGSATTSSTVNRGGSGGGGAGSAGIERPGTAGGSGGSGLSYSISGSSAYYAGGGGGGADANAAGGLGGSGVGGTGGTGGSVGLNAAANTGGGGGGGSSPPSGNIAGTGGNGGSGIVIIRYPL